MKNKKFSQVWSILIVLCIIILGTSVSAHASGDTILVNYNFDDNVLDSSGNGNNGSIGGNVSFVPGYSGKAVSLSGDGWIILPQNLILNNTSFTISMRFKTGSSGGLFGYQNSFVGSNGTTCTQYVPVLSVRSDGKLYAEMWTGNSMTVISNNAVNDNQWHRVVMTSGTNSIRVYLDGVDIGGATGTPQHLSMSISQIGTNAAWGRDYQPGAFTWNHFTGLIDDFIFYSSAQSATEIAKTTQTITFDSLPDKYTSSASFELTATASSGLPVNYTSSNLAVASISGTTVTIHGEGATNISANQTGNATYSAAPQVVRTLTVYAPAAAPIINTQPQNASVTEGNTTTFTVSASAPDDGTLNYQWQKSTDNGAIWTDITDATSASYITGILASGDNGSRYRCIITNSKNATTATATSDAVTLTVNAADTQATPSFSPAGGAIAFGSTVTITSAGADHIYYTTDGSDPATSVGGSTLEYTAPITVSSAMAIKAIAVKAGNIDSVIGSASYTQAASADLTNIVLSGSPTGFTFAGSTYTYNGVTVVNVISSITVTPTGAGSITVEGTTVNTGVESGAIALTAGVQKTITVVVTETGKSAKTYVIKVTREELNAPSAPTIQSAVAGDAHVNITWNSVTGTTGYKIYQSTTSGLYGTALATVGGSVYSYDATGLTNGTTYYFVVKATNGGGDSVNSNEVSATPQVAAPGAPVLQTAVAGDGYVNITWNAVAGSTGYKVYASTTSGSYTTPITTVTGSVYSSDVTGLTNRTTYYFVVKATNPGGDSAYSNEVSAMPQVSASSAPTGVTAAGGNAKVILNWNSVTGATGYKIYQSTTSGLFGDALVTVSGSVYSYEATGLTNGVTYYFVIKATNAGGDSPTSAEVSVMPKTAPGAPTNVTATAGNGEATVTFAAPTDNGGSPITGYVVTSNPGNVTATGTGTTITVTGLTNGTTYTFTVKAVNEVENGQESAASNAVTPYRPSSGGSSGGSSTPSTPTETTKPAETGVEILVNGKTETAATATTTKEGDKTITTVTVDDKKVDEKLQKEGNNAVVTIPVKNDADVVVGQLNGQTVKNMETKEAVLEIKTGNVTYTLPASQINIDNVSSQIGKQVELKDIAVNVKISVPLQETAKIVQDTANKNNYQVVVKPVEFEITCTSGNKTVEVSKFNGYVERMVAIPEGVNPSKITTGIVLNTDGTFSHVPTVITIIDGKYYAKINSLTNSTYSVIWSPKTFKDVENHWAKDAVNDMGSRLIINGVDEDRFEPDRDITRAEFAAIVVRALGLMRPGTGKDTFNDVTKDAWYYDAVAIAYEYGIIEGYGNGKFGLMDRITREQAMTMIARAMKITKLKVEFKDGEAEKLLAAFGDSEKAVDWAKVAIASCIKAEIVSGRSGNLVAPKDNITRAEVAVIVRRLLQKSNLI